MMRKLLLSILLTFVCFTTEAHVGDWNLIRSGNSISEVAKGADSCFYILSDASLIHYDAKDNTLTPIGRKEGLNDVEITHIGYNAATNRLVITYSDFNIDLLEDNGTVYNMPDYMNKSLNEKKDIKAIYIDSIYSYLHTEIGYLKIDMQKALFLSILPLDDKNVPSSNTSLVSASSLPAHLLNEGPLNNWHYHGIVDEGLLLTVPGIWRHWKDYVEKNRPGEVQRFNIKKNEWSLFDNSFKDNLGHIYIENSVIAADPTHSQRYAVGSRTGIYIFDHDTLFEHYNLNNSPLQSALDESYSAVSRQNYTISEGLTYDADGNLWILNDLVDNNELLCLTNKGEWMKFDIPEQGTNWGLCSPIFDRDGHLWFVRRNIDKPYICCFDPTSKGKKIITSRTNQNGSTFSSEITYDVITEGPDDRLWVGTNMGLIYVNRSQKYGDKEENIFQYVVPRNDGSGLGDYLLAGVRINDIKFDAAGRMWVATFNNGVYLVSADLNSMEQHFTSSNSVLPSDCVWTICMDHESGSVFFLTDYGIAQYESDAASGAETWNELYCYPNPVRQEFNGDLTICGLKDGASVYITDSSNKLIYRTTANGSIVRWNLTDEDNNRIDPGIYIVHGIDKNGKEGAKCKFLVQ